MSNKENLLWFFVGENYGVAFLKVVFALATIAFVLLIGITLLAVLL